MFYYLFPLFVLAVATVGYKNQKVGFFLMFLMLFFSMFRGDSVGTDTMSYLDKGESGYQALEYLLEGGGMKIEVLYYALTYFVFQNSLDPHIIIYTFSFITIFFLYLSAKRFNVSIAFVALFYVFFRYYFFSFNIARQFAALSIGLFALSYLKDDSPKSLLFFLWVLIGAMSHNTIVLFVFLFFFRNVCVDRKKAILIVGALYFIMMLIPVTPIFLSLITKLGIGYDMYGQWGDFEIVSVNIVGIAYNLAQGVFFVYFFLTRKTDNKTDVLDVLFLFSLVFMSALAYGNLGTWRLAMNFKIIQCVYFALYFQNNISKQLPIYLIFLLLNYYFVVQFNDGDYYLRLNW